MFCGMVLRGCGRFAACRVPAIVTVAPQPYRPEFVAALEKIAEACRIVPPADLPPEAMHHMRYALLRCLGAMACVVPAALAFGLAGALA